MTTEANEQVFGTASSIYTTPGMTTSSNAAQVGPEQIVTVDGSGTLGVGSAADLGLATTKDLRRLDDKASEGIAMAMAGSSIVLPHEKFVLTANWGTFEGEHGFAGTAAVKLTDDARVQLNGGIAFGASGGNVGARAGVRFGF